MGNFVVKPNELPDIRENYTVISTNVQEDIERLARQLNRLSDQSGFGLSSVVSSMIKAQNRMRKHRSQLEMLSTFVQVLYDESIQEDKEAANKLQTEASILDIIPNWFESVGFLGWLESMEWMDGILPFLFGFSGIAETAVHVLYDLIASGAEYGFEFDYGLGVLAGSLDLLGYKTTDKEGLKFNLTEGDLYAYKKVGLEGYLTKASIENKLGVFSGKSSAELLHFDTDFGGEITLFKDGKFSPNVSIGGSAEGSVLHLETEYQVGTDDLNYHLEGEADVLGGEVKADAGLGYSYENGELQFEAKVEGGAEVYALKGEAKTGFTIFGIDVDVSVEGKLGAAGGTFSAGVTEDGFNLGGGLSALLGVEANLNVDWSDADLPSGEEVLDWLNIFN